MLPIFFDYLTSYSLLRIAVILSILLKSKHNILNIICHIYVFFKWIYVCVCMELKTNYVNLFTVQVSYYVLMPDCFRISLIYFFLSYVRVNSLIYLSSYVWLFLHWMMENSRFKWEVKIKINYWRYDLWSSYLVCVLFAAEKKNYRHHHIIENIEKGMEEIHSESWKEMTQKKWTGLSQFAPYPYV